MNESVGYVHVYRLKLFTKEQNVNSSNLLHESFPSAKCLSQDVTADPPSQKSPPFEHQSPGLGQNRQL